MADLVIDSTETEEKQKQSKASKMMLLFGIVSMTMMFAGLTSGYVVSKTRPDWIVDFKLPSAFFGSTITILLSSFTLHFAWKKLKSGNLFSAKALTLATVILGVLFMVLQFVGFSQIKDAGYFFTGGESSVTTSFIYIIAATHLAHIAFGLLVLVYVFFKLINNKYTVGNTTGFELAKTFWHFVDFLWIYLFLFLYFFG
jgi:cytochrome c oxidase subunit 3